MCPSSLQTDAEGSSVHGLMSVRIDMDWVLFPVFYWVTGVALV